MILKLLIKPEIALSNIFLRCESLKWLKQHTLWLTRNVVEWRAFDDIYRKPYLNIKLVLLANKEILQHMLIQ